MDERRRGRDLLVRYAAIGAAIIVLVHLGSGANGTQGGYVEHPALRLVVLLAWGAFVGGVIGWLARATPSRATLPLGLGTIAAAIGFIVGLWFAVNVQGQDLLDGNPQVQELSELLGAGVGWAIGASIGLAEVNTEPMPSRDDARRTRRVAVAMLLIGVLWASWERSNELDQGLHVRTVAAGVPGVLLLDVALVALTLLVVVGGVGRRRNEGTATSSEGGRSIDRIGRAGMGFGCFVLIAILAAAPQDRRSSETPRQVDANYRSLASVEHAAQQYMEKRRTVPHDLGSLRRFGAHVSSGTAIASIEPLEDGVCVVVGTDNDGVAVEPLVSGIVYLPGRRDSLTEEGGIGIIEPCQGITT
jgi:hypothetical protein